MKILSNSPYQLSEGTESIDSEQNDTKKAINESVEKRPLIKNLLKKLDIGWNDQIFILQKNKADKKLLEKKGGPLLAISILQSTGIRPDELNKGITFSKTGENIEAHINGSKIIKDGNGKPIRGLEWRKIVINPLFCEASGFLFSYVKNKIENNGNKEFKFSYSKNTLRNIMFNLSIQYNNLYRKRKTHISITCYFFRHHMSASLKGCRDISDIERSKIMGHLSTRSIASYAAGYRSKNPVKPFISVQSSEIPHRRIDSQFISYIKSKNQSSTAKIKVKTSINSKHKPPHL